MGLQLTSADIAAIEARTEGWVAGLQLAALSLQDLPASQVSAFLDSFTGSHRFVVDYLMDEVLASQPAHVQTFLRQSSILDRLCGPLCDAVIETVSLPSQQLLEQLERAESLYCAVGSGATLVSLSPSLCPSVTRTVGKQRKPSGGGDFAPARRHLV